MELALTLYRFSSVQLTEQIELYPTCEVHRQVVYNVSNYLVCTWRHAQVWVYTIANTPVLLSCGVYTVNLCDIATIVNLT